MPDGVMVREIGDRKEWLGWRRPNVNASEAGALFGDEVHDYLTAYKLWADRSGMIPDIEDTPAMARGRLLEPYVWELIGAEQPGWRTWRPNLYLSHPEWRIGCTPDLQAERLEDGRMKPGIVQIKTVGQFAFKKKWVDPDTREVGVPLWIAVQATIEALLTGAEWAAVAVLVLGDGGLDLRLIDIPLKPGILDNLRHKVADFWRRVKDNEPYPVDHFKDVELAASFYRGDGSQIDLTSNDTVKQIIDERDNLKQVEKLGEAAAKRRRAMDKTLIANMGNASVATFGDRLIRVSTIDKKAYEVKATSYQQVRVT